MICRILLAAALTALVPLPGAAEEAPDETRAAEAAGPLEEVVVSAFRRAPVLDLGASMTLLDAAVIESASLQHFEELVALVPNMNFSGEGGRARYFQLRGIGELEQYEGAPNPSVGFIVDDIDLSGVGGVNASFDLQQVEVLRGPQATRFGASALAGMVYLQSAGAAAEFDLRAEATLGNDATRAAGIAVGGALADDLAGRFSLHHYRSDGFYDNVALGVDDSNGRDETSARGQLLWDLDHGWQARLALLYADFDNGYDAWSPENARVTFSDHPGRDEQQTSGASLKFSGPLGGAAEFVSISAIADSAVLFSFDGEWGNADYWAPYGYDYVYSDRRDRQSLSQEFRLVSRPGGGLFGGRGDWVMGAYAQRLEESGAILSAGLYDDSADAPFSYCTPCLDRTTLDSDYDATNYAVFGRLDTALSERVSLNAGLRLERWQADYADVFRDFVYGDPGQPGRHAFDPEENLWGGDLGLDYRLRGPLRLYVLVSRGYKAGGFNPSLARVLGAPGTAFGEAVLGPEAIVFAPEDLLNYEAGLKGAWLDGRLGAELSLFRMDRGDMQVRSSAQFTDNPNDFVFVTSNAEGHSWGLEASLAWQVTERWRLHGSLGLLASEIDAYGLEREAGIEGELVGRAFAHAPPYTLNLGASYSGPAGWAGRVDLNAAGSYYFDYSHDEKSGSHRVVNLKFGKEWPHWAVHGWVRNLFDEDYFTRGFYFGLKPPGFERSRYTRLADPRHYGLSVTWRY
ncbi:MAG: TonB-dependent receptor [Lysobacterales bacterium]|nr:MAG: TonB-dependent receptor [Xanthomonadales bacterium]